MSRIDKFKNQRALTISHRYKKRLVDGGKICPTCNKVRELDDYYRHQTYCKKCKSRMGKERRKKQKFKLW